MGDKVATGVTDSEENVDKVVVAGPDVVEGDDVLMDCEDWRLGKAKGRNWRMTKKTRTRENWEGERPILAEAYVWREIPIVLCYGMCFFVYYA